MRLFCYSFLLKKHRKIQNREKLCSSACFLGVKKDEKSIKNGRKNIKNVIILKFFSLKYSELRKTFKKNTKIFW